MVDDAVFSSLPIRTDAHHDVSHRLTHRLGAMTAQTLAELVRRHRAAAGMTQAELAQRARLSERAVSDIERGLRTRVYPVTAQALADALALDGDDRADFAEASRRRPGSAEATPGLEEWLALRRTPLVGRADELAALRTFLDEPSARLVTVTGPGGVGKSRLLAEICAEQPAERTAWVSLATLREAALVLPTIAGACGLPREVPTSPLARALSAYDLVVLDTFEAVTDAATELASLLDQTHGCRVVVTSRVPLRVRGERELALSGLPTTDATTLLAARVRDIRPSALTGVDDALVGQIAERLAGVPLALELAAARARHLSLPGLLDALDRPLQVLHDGPRDLPERQRTMRATIEWSYELLDGDEQMALRRLSAFAASWSAEDAASLCADETAAMVDLTGRLAEHGFVVADGDTGRWRLPDPIRDYAHERRTDAELREDTRRHASLVTAAVEQMARQLLGAEQAQARTALRVMVDDSRAALRTAVDERDAGLALRLAAATWMFWRLEGAFDEGSRWLQAALSMPGAESDPAWAGAAWGRAWIAYQQGDLSTASSYATLLVDRPAAAERRNGLTLLGHVALARGEVEDAVQRLEAGLDLAHDEGEPWIVATSLLNLGTALVHGPDPDAAHSVLEAALAGHEAAGDLLFAARDRLQLGYAALRLGSQDAAAGLFAAAFTDLLDRDDPWGVADALAALAVVRAASGDDEGAALLSGAANAAWERVGAKVLGPDANLGAAFLAGARARLGKSDWSAAERRGQVLPPASALAATLRPAG
jgi:predicted ATPase/DNA-binding XRE family transcriptional regulator